MATKERCLIIMPISTPEAYIPLYRDGKEHFKHVLDCLFIPAVEKAGFTPEPPIAKGSDLIHAEIIKIIEKAEIVLCDMSSLNPNVFFEFGIRTSLNKPVCVVKDELTKQVPFDTAILNYQEYESTIEPWKINVEIEKIASHLRTSAERSKSENTLWKYFGIKAEAAPLKAETDTDSKLDFLTNQIQSLRERLEYFSNRAELRPLPPMSQQPLPTTITPAPTQEIVNEIVRLMNKLPQNLEISTLEINPKNMIKVNYRGNLSENDRLYLSSEISKRYGVMVDFKNLGPKKIT